jgi:hypothetical protein
MLGRNKVAATLYVLASRWHEMTRDGTKRVDEPKPCRLLGSLEGFKEKSHARSGTNYSRIYAPKLKVSTRKGLRARHRLVGMINSNPTEVWLLGRPAQIVGAFAGRSQIRSRHGKYIPTTEFILQRWRCSRAPKCAFLALCESRETFADFCRVL